MHYLNLILAKRKASTTIFFHIRIFIVISINETSTFFDNAPTNDVLPGAAAPVLGVLCLVEGKAGLLGLLLTWAWPFKEVGGTGRLEPRPPYQSNISNKTNLNTQTLAIYIYIYLSLSLIRKVGKTFLI